jgi:hypothetical protein
MARQRRQGDLPSRNSKKNTANVETDVTVPPTRTLTADPRASYMIIPLLLPLNLQGGEGTDIVGKACLEWVTCPPCLARMIPRKAGDDPSLCTFRVSERSSLLNEMDFLPIWQERDRMREGDYLMAGPGSPAIQDVYVPMDELAVQEVFMTETPALGYYVARPVENVSYAFIQEMNRRGLAPRELSARLSVMEHTKEKGKSLFLLSKKQNPPKRKDSNSGGDSKRRRLSVG